MRLERVGGTLDCTQAVVSDGPSMGSFAMTGAREECTPTMNGMVALWAGRKRVGSGLKEREVVGAVQGTESRAMGNEPKRSVCTSSSREGAPAARG